MKLQIVLTAALAGSALAQAPQIRIEKNNDPWLVISATKNTAGVNYNWVSVTPAAYNAASQTPGVAAGLEQMRWLPHEVNSTQGAWGANNAGEKVSGVFIGIRPSAGTTSFPHNAYFPRTRIYKSKNVSGSGGWFGGEVRDADRSGAPLVDYNPQGQAKVIAMAQRGNFVVSRTLANAVTLPVNALANQSDKHIGYEFVGGEHRDKPNGQSFFSSFSDGLHSPTTGSFWDPAGQGSSTAITTNFGVTWGSYVREDQISFQQYSDWGYRRDSRLPPRVSGRSVGTGQSDLSTTAGTLGWYLLGGQTRANHNVAILFNFGQVFPATFTLAGVTIRVNPADPSLGATAAITGTIDAQGQFKSPAIPIPVLGGPALNTIFGAQGVAVDLSGNPPTITAGEANWIKNAR